MKITFIAYGNIQTGGPNGIETHEFQAGQTVTVSADIAALFIQTGVAIPAKSEKAVKPKGETATK